ncbi:MAG: hypothetical protein A2298_05375 [Gammaproteobacteria bacterium RIFOXYB2_FULL_38_6]|nr:MAG: hypothetical protein A2298_05375 [Gammaproteobacteria bacterium RIFOXYB2_FULL_38_6]
MLAQKIIHTDQAPKAIGPYSQAVQFGNLIFVSGQVPLNPKTGDLVSEEINSQTIQVLENLKAILESANSSLKQVLKTQVFLKDMNDFVKVNEIYARYFTDNFPARIAVQVARLPKDVLVEIDAIAFTK